MKNTTERLQKQYNDPCFFFLLHKGRDFFIYPTYSSLAQLCQNLPVHFWILIHKKIYLLLVPLLNVPNTIFTYKRVFAWF